MQGVGNGFSADRKNMKILNKNRKHRRLWHGILLLGILLVILAVPAWEKAGGGGSGGGGDYSRSSGGGWMLVMRRLISMRNCWKSFI